MLLLPPVLPPHITDLPFIAFLKKKPKPYQQMCIIYYCQTRVVSHVSVSAKMSSTSKHHRLHKLDSVRPVHYRKDTPVGTKCQAFAHHLMNKTK